MKTTELRIGNIIGLTHEHFYSVSSVNRVIEKLVNKINELENKIKL